LDKAKPYLLLLTARSTGWAAGRFRRAAKDRGIAIRTLDPADVMLETGSDTGSVMIAGRRLSAPIAVIPRFGPGNYENGLALLSQLEASGIPTCNPGYAIALARDTYRTLLELRNAGLRIPKTARVLSIRDLKPARGIVPGPPWILKTFTGAMGIGTMLVRDVDQLEALAATLWALGQPILMQEYVYSSSGKSDDIRALVVGGKVLGAIQRLAPSGGYRANVHQGGTPQEIRLSRREKTIALKAAKAVGLNMAGVDWIETVNGPVLLEVNATPGFQGFESATGIDAAGAMVDYSLRLAGR